MKSGKVESAESWRSQPVSSFLTSLKEALHLLLVQAAEGCRVLGAQRHEGVVVEATQVLRQADVAAELGLLRGVALEQWRC